MHTLAIKQRTWAYFKIQDEVAVPVTELNWTDPGCPLLETVIAVFEPARTRKWRLHRPRSAVTKIMIQPALAAPPAS